MRRNRWYVCVQVHVQGWTEDRKEGTGELKRNEVVRKSRGEFSNASSSCTARVIKDERES
jgi:hypothetical protein